MPIKLSSKTAARQFRKRTKPRGEFRFGAPILGTPHVPPGLAIIASPSQPLFPTATRRMLRYSDDIALSVVGGVMANYIFRANDLYDPNVTSTGHQPMGFDQMMVFFDHFVVESCKVTALFTNSSSSNPFGCLRLEGNNVTITDPTIVKETGGCVYAQMNQASPNQSQALTMDLDVARFHGINKTALTATESLTGSISSSPSDGIFAHVCAWDPVAANSTIRVTVVMELIAVFLEPRVPSLSRLELVQDASRMRRQRKLIDELKHA